MNRADGARQWQLGLVEQTREGKRTVSKADEMEERGWLRLPPEYRIPDRAPTLGEAQAWVQQLAEGHYENFHVATWFLPRLLKPHFHSIYAYCRVSDDLGDEVGDPEASLALLNRWGRELEACYRGEARHPVFVALRPTILECGIPIEPFQDLLVAFRQDQTVTRYKSMDDVLQYCRYSANPVGRLVLYACGYRDEERFQLSDRTCSALQLANFWQDVRVDFDKGRIYLPSDDMERFGVDETSFQKSVVAGVATPEFRSLMRFEVEFARRMFCEGLALAGMVDRELAVDIELFSRGGLEVLNAIERRGFDVLRERPAISKARKARLLARAMWGKYAGRLRRQASSPSGAHPGGSRPDGNNAGGSRYA